MIGPKSVWKQAIFRAECDTNAGEVYMKNSPGKVPSLDQCKQSCEATRGCQSITFFRSGYCSLFNTTCTKTRRNNKAVALLSLMKPSGIPAVTTGIPASTPKATPAASTSRFTTAVHPESYTYGHPESYNRSVKHILSRALRRSQMV